VLARLRRVPLRLATRPRIRRTPARRSHAYPRHHHPRLRLAVPLVIAAAVGLAIAPLDATRALPSATWAPFPATAFRELPALDAMPSGRQPGENAAPSGDASAGRGTAPRGVTQRGAHKIDTAASKSSGSPGTISLPGATEAIRGADWRSVSPTRPGGTFGASSPMLSVQPTPAALKPPHGPTHVVVAGDTLWMIAIRHNAELAAVLRWNQGLDPYRLVAGQRILVPGGSKMAPLPQPRPAASSRAVVRPSSANRAAAANDEAGNHIWPLPVRGMLTRGFSAAHPGIDIAAPQGARVRAIAAGTVVWAGWKNNGGGYVVIVRHPNGMTSTYNHDSKVTVAKGDVVGQGDTIALVGSTGNSTGSHLDLRIEMGGRLINPLSVY